MLALVLPDEQGVGSRSRRQEVNSDLPVTGPKEDDEVLVRRLRKIKIQTNDRCDGGEVDPRPNESYNRLEPMVMGIYR